MQDNRLMLEYAEGDYGSTPRCNAIRIDARATSKLRPPDKLFDNFESAIEKLKARKMRADIIRDAANMLALRLIDYLDDRDGFNGEQRMEWLASPDAARYMTQEMVREI